MSVLERIAALSPEQRILFEKLRETQREAARTHQPPPIPRVSGPTGEGDWPLSLDQERFWFMEQLFPDGAGLNISAATRMRGPLAVPVVAAALAEIVRRHAAWRTTFPRVDGMAVQRVDASRRQLLAVIDLSALPWERRESEALHLVREDAAAPFDLEHGPLVRASLLRLDGEDHLCLLTVHHLVVDFPSFQIVWSELAALYAAFAAGRAAALPTPAVQYSDFAVWQREWLQGEVLTDLTAWWRERLVGFPLALDLPTDRPRPAVLRMRGGRRLLRASGELSERLRTLARQEGATLFMTVLAAAAAMLSRDSGQEELILGANNANRNRPELQTVVGTFLTQVPFPLDLAGDPTFRELLVRARRSALDTYAHQDLPFGKLVEVIQPQRDTSRQPIIQTLVQVLDGEPAKADLAGITFESVDAFDGNARYELLLTLFDHPDGLAGSLEYDADLFDPMTAERLGERLLLQAEAFTADPGLRLSALPALTAAARHQVLTEWNDAAKPLPGWTVPERFAEQVARTPEAPAVVAGGETLTYGELDRRAAALAQRLRALGVVPEARVALLLGRNPDTAIAMLGVWKAGGAFVPLDPTAPGERLAGLLADAQPAVVIHRGPLPVPLAAGAQSLDLAFPDLEWEVKGSTLEIHPGQLAYLIYTSGTTGRPKAVSIEHGSLAMVLATVVDRFALTASDRVAHLARFSLDISLVELFAPLLAGGVCEILAEDDVLDPAGLLAALERATWAHAVPSLMRRIVEEARRRGPERLAGLRTLLTGGDLVPPDLLADLLATFPGAEIATLYGPTETTIVCAGGRVTREHDPQRPLIGRPLDNVELRVMDPRGGLVPLGVPGELWVGGPGVARGYFRRDELTAERFVVMEGRRFYRTGDLVRQLPAAGGALEFLGRTDLQVKIRGFRIEPGEVEAALLDHPAVQQAVVVARADGTGERRLVGYVVSVAACPASELREHLAARLPAYMVPAAFVTLPALPLTSHGKVDRARLPAPAAPEAAGEDAPRTPAEEIVAGIWCEVLDLPRISRAADFFALGGHSLLATRVVSRLRAATGAELPIREIFQSPTVAALATALEASLSAGSSAAAAPPILPVPRTGNLPLSFAQERLWFLDRLAPGNAAYNIPLALAAHGELSLPALEAALGEMVRRHEALRTTYEPRGDRPAQVIAPPSSASLPLVDLADLPETLRREEARRLADDVVAAPFDLARDPVLRAWSLRLGPAEHALLLTVHHIAADGWSVGVMVEEIAALYPAALAGTASRLPDLPVQYADFAVWQRAWLQGEVLDRQLGYWRERLAGLPALALPTDRPRPRVQSFRGATRMHPIGPETTRALVSLARQQDATLFMVLLAGVQALLGRLAGQEDLAVGSPIANRTRAEIEPLIGFFVNSLVLRGDLAGDPPFGKLVARARRAALEAYSHQDLPFERLVEELRPERRLAHNPLFQVMFALQNAPLRAIDLPGLTFSPVELAFPATRFDLEILFTEVEAGLSTQLTWSTDLFDPATVLRLAGWLDALLAAVIADPSRRLSAIPLLAAPERHQALVDWNDTAAEISPADVVGGFARNAATAPRALAVSAGATSLSYGELAARAGVLARELRALGVGPDVPVGLHADRSPELVIGALAVLWAGGAYVPLDPSLPAERLAYMVGESGMTALLSRTLEAGAPPPWTGGARVIRLDASAPVVGAPVPWTSAPPETLAYVLYTSGSTGRPKGVQVSRAGLSALIAWHLRAWQVTARDRATLIASPAFDASVWEVWPYLAAGASLHVPDEETRLLPDRLLAWLAAEGITFAFLPTPLAEQTLARELPAGLALRALLTGGDRLQRAPHRPLPFVLGNHYGPTESSVVATWTTVAPEPAGEAARAPAIGRPVDGTRVYGLDPHLRPVPLGAPGELAIAGAGLARGYLGRPDLTAERFLPDPFSPRPGERMYRTGDLIRHLPGGEIEFLGRLDTQVKVRGFRIELGEIESVLARHPRVREAVAVARDDGDNGEAGPRLAAYVVQRPADDGEAGSHISQWQELYDETYGKGVAEDPTFNVQGWNSSYTGEPIPADEMREWVDTTVERLLELPHRRVLEVGCGTGLLLFRVAPHAERYRGTDFSAVALNHVRRQVARPGNGLAHVELERRLADDWTGVEPGEYDLVVLNSVVQYFPSADYLARVLSAAARAVAPGGAIFVGDVRSRPLLAAFYAEVELYQAAPERTVAELRARVRRRVEDEEELVLDPAFFAALARRLPGARSEVLLKRGRAHNELNRFRYDVVLHLDGAVAPEVTEPRAGLANYANAPLEASLARRLVPELRRALEAELPEYMVPADIVLLDALPLTPAGKIDRAALPAPDRRGEPAATWVPPTTPLEELLASTAAELLGVERVGMGDNFFELGGHSLLATQLVSRLTQQHGLRVTLHMVFDAATFADLAARIVQIVQREAAPERIPRRPPGLDPISASFAQERLWFMDRLAPGSPAYNIPIALQIRGEVAPALLAAVIGEVVRRHEALRTTFREQAGQPVQVIAPPDRWSLPVVDLAGLPTDARGVESRRLAQEEAQRPFAIERGPLLRAALLRSSANEHALLLNLHHIVSDGWSMGVLVREIGAIYGATIAGIAAIAAARSPLPELPIQYADFAVWQRDRLQGEVLEQQLAYWRERLEGAPPSLDLPTDRPRPAAQTYRGARLRIHLDADFARGLRQLARRYEASPFMALLAGFQALLGRLTGQRDLTVGSPIANRHRAEVEPLIGFFVNTLVMRGDLRGEPAFGEGLARVRRTTLEAYAHQDLPFERLVVELGPERHLAVTPLFQAVCAMQNAPVDRMELPGLSFSPIESDATTTQFDLELHAWEAGDGLEWVISYSIDLFDAPSILRLAGHLEALLRGAMADPAQRISGLPLVTAAERHQLLCEWNDSAAVPPAAGIAERVAAWAARAPEAPAVVCNGAILAYGELLARASRLAGELRELGVGPEAPVGLCAGRSPELVVGALAVLLAGGAYLPLDPSSPEERLEIMLADSRAQVLLTASGFAGRLAFFVGPTILLDQDPSDPAYPTDPSDLLEAPHPTNQNLAYLIYTSGSTGRPKGVEASHGGLLNLVEWHHRTYRVTPGDRATLVASPAFDASVWEIWPYLTAGASLHVPDEEVRLRPERLLEWLAGEGITLCFLPTPLAERVLDVAASGLPPGLRLRALLTGGDRLQQSPRASLPFPLVNHYGPTESSVVASAAVVEPAPAGPAARPPAIGRPIAGIRAHVLDGRLEPVPIGVAGELFLGGIGLARGYRGQPDLTAERFVPDPAAEQPGERLYRTGDRARLLPDGNLEFLGRIDTQVKLRGFRIELGEIESALLRHPSVRDAVVELHAGGSSGPQLAAYVVCDLLSGEIPEHVSEWQALYDETYGRSQAADATFDIVGWNSTYTGQPIPAEEMREWVERTVERIAALDPRRVLEIGCGTGLLLFRLAPRAESYLGTDFSRVSLDRIRRRLAGELPQIALRQSTADDWSGIAPGEADLVILNSVVQYFPGIDYLVQVLEGAVRAVAPSGAVFVGDVRSLPLLEALHTSVELFQSPGSREVAELRRRVRRRVADEEELVVDPAFFFALARKLPAVRRVSLLLKRGRWHNELTRFRYDVVLHVGDGETAAAPSAVRAQSLAEVEELLAAGPEALAVVGLPNARLSSEAAALEPQASATVEELREAVAGQALAGVDPEALAELGERLGYDVALTVDSTSPFRFGAVFGRGKNLAALTVPELPDLPWRAFANDPLAGKRARRLAPELRGFLQTELPDYMVPAAFVLLDSLPLTLHGKVDRAALPAPEPLPGRPGGGTAPRTPIEAKMAALWREVLGVEEVGLEDNFFALGGHSLLATQLASRVRAAFGVELPVRLVFERPTLGELTAGVAALTPAATAARRPGLSAAPLSFAQERAWALDQLMPGSSVFNLPSPLLLRGPLDPDVLERALQEIRRRQGSLRTRFVERDGAPVQIVDPPGTWRLSRVDLDGLPSPLRRGEAERLVAEEASQPFDLRRGPLFRSLLVRLGEREHALLLTCHHIVSDGWSTQVLFRELTEHYAAFLAGGPPPLPEPPLQYAELAVWQRERLTGPLLESQLAYWRENLAGAPPRLDLPLDRPRPALQTYRGEQLFLLLPADLLAALQALSASETASLYMTLLAGLALLLSRWSCQEEVVVGSPVAGREQQEVEGLIGFFLNLLPMRVDLSGRPTFRQLLRRARRTAVGAYAHQDVPFERVLQELRLEGDPSYHPVFQVLLNVLNLPPMRGEIPGGLAVEPLDLQRVESKYDFTLYAAEGADGLFLNLVYNPDLFDCWRMEELLRQYGRILEQAAEDPERAIESFALDELAELVR